MTGKTRIKGWRYCPKCRKMLATTANFERYPNGRWKQTCMGCDGIDKRKTSPPPDPSKVVRRGPQPMGIPPECDEWERYKLAAPYRAVRVIE